MKLWIDDVRPAPDGYVWLKSVNEARAYIIKNEDLAYEYYSLARLKFDKGDEVGFFNCLDLGGKHLCEVIDIDHDAGDYEHDGGDYIKLLDWLEETGRSYPIRIHSMNPVGVENMRVIIERNGWVEVL
jgi:hypothetical protein